MAERYTTAQPLDRTRSASGIGWTEYGRQTRAHMLAAMRAHYRHQMEQAQYVLSLSDDDLIVQTHTGVYRWREVEEVTDHD